MIFRAGLAEGRYIVIALLTTFIAIAFLGVLYHINRMVFGRPSGQVLPTPAAPRPAAAPPESLPSSCTTILVLSGTLVVILGIYLPPPLHQLLKLASDSLHR
jgi:formate hydrogenlyase subunit 3/multisubunit Na+/H+ antiporter MnhD subunit